MDVIEATKKAAKEYIAAGKTKGELLCRLEALANVNETINYIAKYGLYKSHLRDQMLRRKILKDPSLIGL